MFQASLFICSSSCSHKYLVELNMFRIIECNSSIPGKSDVLKHGIKVKNEVTDTLAKMNLTTMLSVVEICLKLEEISIEVLIFNVYE